MLHNANLQAIVSHWGAETVRTPEGQRISLRRATREDAMIVFEWQTSPGTRVYARNRQVPSLTEHLDWFSEKVASDDSQIWVGLSDGRPFGIVRLDRRDEEWEVSIVVAPHMRGSGFGKAMLAAIDEISRDKKLFAEVLPGNQASHALFRAAGYRLSPDGRYRRSE